ncbi:MAG: DUF4340 domain-containing protein [Polyangiaceae bacterium]
MALSRDKQIIVGVVVLAGLGGLAYVQVKKDQEIGKAPATVSADIPTVSSPEDVDKISITHADKGEVVLEKKGDKWEVTKPVSAPANQANVKQLIDNMKELKAKEVLANAADDSLKKLYDLEPSKAVHVMAWKGADKKVDNLFGKSGSRGQAVMVEGKPQIFGIPSGAGSYSSYLYTREVKGWRDTEIFKFDDANAIQFSVTSKDGPLSFTKGGDGKWAGTQKGQPIPRFDEEKVKDALRALKGLNAEDFGDGKPTTETGLDAPEAVVTVLLKDNAGKYVLNVGKTTGPNRFAQKEGSPTIFVVGSWASAFLTGDVSKFQKPLDGGAGKQAAAAPPGMPPGMDLESMGGMPPGHP